MKPNKVGPLPLGARPSPALGEEQIRSLKTLSEYDLSPISRRLSEKGIMPSSWIDEAVFEFRRFLGLRLVTDRPVPMMSRQVDEVWHACLLFSRLYADLCNQAFGSFVHHEPTAGPDPDAEATWTAFRSAYEAMYGSIGRIWLLGREEKQQ